MKKTFKSKNYILEIEYKDDKELDLIMKFLEDTVMQYIIRRK